MTQTTIEKSESTVTSSGFTDFILRRLRVAALKHKIVANEIEAVTVALSGGLIAADEAVLMLRETGLEISS